LLADAASSVFAAALLAALVAGAVAFAVVRRAFAAAWVVPESWFVCSFDSLMDNALPLATAANTLCRNGPVL
jgi:hypothetical protein